MRDDIEVAENYFTGDFVIGGEVVGNRAGETRPLLDRYRTRRPAMVPRMHPSVPERESDVQASKFRRNSPREAMLEPVETSAYLIELSGLMRVGVETQIRHQRVAGLRVSHHHRASPFKVGFRPCCVPTR